MGGGVRVSLPQGGLTGMVIAAIFWVHNCKEDA
jgi:hypothetical protein